MSLSYHAIPGHKAPGTSADAALSIAGRAETLRNRVLAVLMIRSMTADEVAEYLGESILSIRPRLSELRAMRLTVDTGERRPNASGHRAIVWAAVRKSWQPTLI